MSATRDVSDETFASEVLDASGPVVVDFWAPWCGPCKTIEPLLEAIAAERSYRLVKLDVDANLGVPSRYGVLSLPTVILFADGEPRVTIHGARSRAHYERAFAEALAG